MDIQRPDLAKRKKRVRAWTVGILSTCLLAAIASLLFLGEGDVRVDRTTLWIGTVQEGEMMRDVRGNGTLVPDEVRWVPSRSSGRIERILVLPGARVDTDTVLLEMSNPVLMKDARALELRLRSEEAQFIGRKEELQSSLLQRKSTLAQLSADLEQQRLEANISAELHAEGLESKLRMLQSKLRAQQSETRYELEIELFASAEKATLARIEGEQAQIDQTRSSLELIRADIEGLQVRSGFSGILQRLNFQEGQQVQTGASLGLVANPDSLKAVLQVSEHLAKDVLIGQKAEIDTRNGKVVGEVIRVDPNVVNGTVSVDIRLPRDLPQGVRPDLSIDGTIEIERIEHAVFVDRPVFAKSDITASLFKLAPGSTLALRTPVQFGRSSANRIEIVNGLQVGDRIILSDMSEWDREDRLEIR